MKWHWKTPKYGEGWVKHQIDAVNARVHELDELFYIWRYIKEMDKEEEAAKAEPEINTVMLPDPEVLKEKQ